MKMCSKQKCFWVIIVFIGISQTQAVTTLLRLYKAVDEFTEVNLKLPLSILQKSSGYDPSIPTFIFIFGYTGMPTGPASNATMQNRLKYGQPMNVMMLNWKEGASSGGLNKELGYLFAIQRMKKIAIEFGNALVKLKENGMNVTELHIAGHSLGAQLAGYAGKQALKLGLLVHSISGWDPAGVFFDGVMRYLQDGLDKTCAKYVRVLHTNPGDYGTNETLGTIDYWINGVNGLQPGCPKGNFEKFSAEDMCSHNRVWMYSAEAEINPEAYVAVSEGNYPEWIENKGQNRLTTLMYTGQKIDPDATGNYFLTTNAQSPYGKGEEGITPDPTQEQNSPSFLSKLNNLVR